VGHVVREGKQSWRIGIEGSPQEMWRLRFRSRRTAQRHALKWLEENHKVTRQGATIAVDFGDFTSKNAPHIMARLLREERRRES